MVHERRNKTVSIAKHMKFQGKLTFTYALAVKSGKLKSAKENQGTRHFENIIYRVLNEAIRLLLSRST